VLPPPLPVLGVVTGLTAEARLARPLGLVRAGGGTPEGAEAAAEALVARGAGALLSFGLAGGLDPALAPGTLVIPLRLQTTAGAYTIDAALARRFGEPAGMLFAAREAVTSAQAKAALFAATGALAVDLESASTARTAAAHGLPFAVLRAICDPATRSLPPAALAALDGSGAIAPFRLLASLLRHPGQVRALALLAADAAVARAALRRAVRQSAAWETGGSAGD
jgi:adenosylhomocysteine nucleosidase